MAVKELQPTKNPTDDTCADLEPEKASWSVYHEVNLEARMMYRLNHPHILTLLGITLQPVRLVLELAREDLAATVTRYQKKNKRFSRRTLRATLTQASHTTVSNIHTQSLSLCFIVTHFKSLFTAREISFLLDAVCVVFHSSLYR